MLALMCLCDVWFSADVYSILFRLVENIHKTWEIIMPKNLQGEWDYEGMCVSPKGHIGG